jgi:hypothetical protein
MDLVISAVVGLIAGAVGSLMAPWVHWSIEKRREAAKYRVDTIARWRAAIDTFDFDRGNFGDTTTYAEMRSHMREEVIRKFEAQRTIHVPPDGGRGDQLARQWASDELSRIQQSWGLI